MKDISRRSFLKLFGAGTVATTAALAGCKSKEEEIKKEEYKNQVEPPKDKMTYRVNPNNNDKVSLLGYGMMRLPNVVDPNIPEHEAPIDQEQVNKLVDYAIEHGVNYFDTSPAYCQGHSEESTGIALARHDRSKFYVATKMSNFSPNTWTPEGSKEMFHNSLKYLKVDYIDYLLLHSIGGDSRNMKGESLNSLETFNARYMDNGVLDWLVEQKKAGKIRNLGFSFHGDVAIYDMLLKWHDEGKYHWDFVQIELNYLDWDFADEINNRNTDASYLYAELKKRNIPAVIMEPLLGGRLANVPQFVSKEMKQRDNEASVASWAFRYAGTPDGVLSVLSGMTYMEHLKDNLLTLSPLKPITEEEDAFLMDIARKIFNVQNIPCNDCKYCMPCPYGVNIPAIFVHYNKFKNEGLLPSDTQDPEYRKYRRQYLIDIDRSIPRERQAQHCIGCGQCVEHCPQRIRIPGELQKIDKFIEQLKQDTSV